MFFFWLDITSHQALNKLKGNLIDVIFNSRNFSQSQKFPKSGVGGMSGLLTKLHSFLLAQNDLLKPPR